MSVTPLANSDPAQEPPGGSIALCRVPAMAVDVSKGGSPAVKDRTIIGIITQIADYYDGLDTEVGRFLDTSRDRKQSLNATDGCFTT